MVHERYAPPGHSAQNPSAQAIRAIEGNRAAGDRNRAGVARMFANWQPLYDELCARRRENPDIKNTFVMAAMVLDAAKEQTHPKHIQPLLDKFMRLYGHDAQIVDLNIR